MRFIVKHRGDGMYLGGVVGGHGLWTLSLRRAHRFASPEDAFTTAFVTCVSVPLSDLQVVPIIEQPIAVPA